MSAMTIALYKDAEGKYSGTYIKDYNTREDGSDYWEFDGGYVRISEPLEVEFLDRDKAEVDARVLEEIDRQIAEEVAKHEEKMQDLKSRKALLTCIE